jgi:hypothetical protein
MPELNVEAWGDFAALAVGGGLAIWIAFVLRLATRRLWSGHAAPRSAVRFSTDDEFYLHSLHVRL